MEGQSGTRPPYRGVADWLATVSAEEIAALRFKAIHHFKQIGITFAVYGDTPDPEKLIPFDLIPRIINAEDWALIDRGCIQRAKALNAFIADVYGDQRALRDGVVPRDLVLNNEAYRPAMRGVRPPKDIWAHIIGVDLIATQPGTFNVLEDNCRTPSGISYMLEARNVLARVLPDLLDSHDIRPVDTYPTMLLNAMKHCAPEAAEDADAPSCVILTPGRFNSAYYEHSFLADRMGIELVSGKDLFVDTDDRVYKRTIAGPAPVDLIYRRIDDDFLDPEEFCEDSMLGVPGLMRAYRAGTVTLMNAPGAGIADDKAIYCFVPDMIKYYLGEEAVLPNVKTWRCGEADHLAEVLDDLEKLVVKEVHGSGGYGMLIGPKSTPSEVAAYRKRLMAEPEGFVAQPTLYLSQVPCFDAENQVSGRHVDLRPFVVMGEQPQLVPGGLTRVALKEGSLVVNSSQDGGVKDTWVMAS